jgi:Tol biopolymer transport system component
MVTAVVPDGSAIAFGMHPPGTPGYFEDIYTVGTDGTSLQRITSSRGGSCRTSLNGA